MKFDHLPSKSFVAWKVAAIALASFVAVASYLISPLREQGLHGDIMFLSLVVVISMCLWLFRDLNRVIQRRSSEIDRLMAVNLSLTSLIDLKDHYTEGHSRNVRNLSRDFAEYLGMTTDRIDEIALAALLHDIGKIGISDDVLKKAGPLTDGEFVQIKAHPDFGASAVEPIEEYGNVAEIIRHHHERFDGTGYPAGLAGTQIPYGARLIALADTYDALIHGRAYRAPMSSPQALNTIREQSGKQFDPTLADAFVQFIEAGEGADTHHDPVCGMPLNDLTVSTIFMGRRFYFCSQTCLREFNQRPTKYTT